MPTSDQHIGLMDPSLLNTPDAGHVDLTFDFESLCGPVDKDLPGLNLSPLSGPRIDCDWTELNAQPYTPESQPSQLLSLDKIEDRSAPKTKRKTDENTKSQQPRKRKTTSREEIRINHERPHYAVEKRYRSGLNEKYATLARTVVNERTQAICRKELPELAVKIEGSLPGLITPGDGRNRQSKTATLSVALDVIVALTNCCSKKAKELEELRRGSEEVRARLKSILGSHVTELAQDAPSCS